MQDNRSFQWLHRQLQKTHSFHVNIHDDARRTALANLALFSNTTKIRLLFLSVVKRTQNFITRIMVWIKRYLSHCSCKGV
ncbi:hypothetical protein TNCV_3326931 [Trichonephila clavipes]|nr:hypothetical protein TNCV_3326931 [Trichonephila clavipes]